MSRMRTWIAVATLLAGACSERSEKANDDARPVPARPGACRVVKAGDSLQAVIDASSDGAALCLGAGTHAGPVEIRKAITLWGPRDAVVKSDGKGTTILVTANGAKVEGLTVSGSGGRFDVLDAAVKVHANDVEIRGIRVEDATFGILVEKAKRIVVAGCEVQGQGGEAHGLRGDGIRLWETNESRIEDNFVADSRDLVVWYSSDNVLARNVVRRGRYGTHFMYSHRNRVEQGLYESNVVGIFVMYSRHITISDTLLADSSGPAGMGLGLKESGAITVRHTRFVHDAIGLYLDTSPLQEGDANVFEGNEFRLGRAGVVFHSSETRNTFRGNTFRDLDLSVQVEGGGDALGVAWDGNDFDDYAGYDLDRDGTGDLPYELRSASGALEASHPETGFFRGTPALALVDLAARVLPLFAPKLLVRDARPHVGAIAWEAGHAR